ncbi:ATP-binding cassette domain-containing protein [Bengtsoniella intestinalis]|uniref:sulfate/molybdate ABC transporter ATP-binding protein n=1 Tax=Bengtsoniella intestinalis TaxID=3073143 RepID=UPI00391F8720
MKLEVSIRKQLGDFALAVEFTTHCGVLGLLGQSGSGKSVTLQCIAGIMSPDGGRIVLDGQVLFDSELSINLPPQKRNIGYLFQHYALFPHWTVEKNLQVIDKENAFTMLEKLGLEQVRCLLPHQLSGGEKQRVALGRMLLGKPKVVLFDEPLSALDAHLSWAVEQHLSTILQELECPVIWVSHDAGEVRRNCANICVLDSGRSEKIVDTATLFAHPITLAAARLSGFENVLTSDQSPWDTKGAGIAVRGKDLCCVQENKNAILCDVAGQYEDLDGRWTVLRPVCGDDQTILRMKGGAEGQRVWLEATQIHHLQ